MSKATCSKCGFKVFLKAKSPEGTDFWSIKDAMNNLINQLRGHICK